MALRKTCKTCKLLLPAYVAPFAPHVAGCACQSYEDCPGARHAPEPLTPSHLPKAYVAHACFNARPVCLCADASCITCGTSLRAGQLHSRGSVPARNYETYAPAPRRVARGQGAGPDRECSTEEVVRLGVEAGLGMAAAGRQVVTDSGGAYELTLDENGDARRARLSDAALDEEGEEPDEVAISEEGSCGGDVYDESDAAWLGVEPGLARSGYRGDGVEEARNEPCGGTLFAVTVEQLSEPERGILIRALDSEESVLRNMDWVPPEARRRVGRVVSEVEIEVERLRKHFPAGDGWRVTSKEGRVVVERHEIEPNTWTHVVEPAKRESVGRGCNRKPGQRNPQDARGCIVASHWIRGTHYTEISLDAGPLPDYIKPGDDGGHDEEAEAAPRRPDNSAAARAARLADRRLPRRREITSTTEDPNPWWLTWESEDPRFYHGWPWDNPQVWARVTSAMKREDAA